MLPAFSSSIIVTFWILSARENPRQNVLKFQTFSTLHGICAHHFELEVGFRYNILLYSELDVEDFFFYKPAQDRKTWACSVRRLWELRAQVFFKQLLMVIVWSRGWKLIIRLCLKVNHYWQVLQRGEFILEPEGLHDTSVCATVVSFALLLRSCSFENRLQLHWIQLNLAIFWTSLLSTRAVHSNATRLSKRVWSPGSSSQI